MANSSECELCGRSISAPVRAKIEGTVMEVCNNCSQMGQKLQAATFAQKEARHLQQPAEELMDNYPAIIRNARQKLNLTIEQLAMKLSEKDFVVRRVEEGKLKPDPALAKKFEKFLGVKIIQFPTESEVSGRALEVLNRSSRSPGEACDEPRSIGESRERVDRLTLGDFIKIRKKG